MKKLLLLSIVFALSVGVYAQKFGIRGGANLATMTGSADGFNDDKTGLLGIHLGVVYEMKLIPMIFIQGEMLYSQKGIYYEIAGGNYSKTTINYIEVPISGKIKLGPTPLYIIAGPYFAYALSGKTKVKIGGVEASEDLKWKDAGIKRTDMGLNAGLGVRFGLGPIALFAEGRYGIGFADINDDGTNETIKNRNLQFSTGIMIGL